MSDLNDTLKDSYIAKVPDFVTPYTDELKAKDFDPTSRLAQLSAAGKTIEGAHKLRLQAEQAVVLAVQQEQQVRGQFYTLATGTVSLVEGALGKTHELTVKLRSLRSDLIGNQNPNGTPTPAPATVKTA